MNNTSACPEQSNATNKTPEDLTIQNARKWGLQIWSGEGALKIVNILMESSTATAKAHERASRDDKKPHFVEFTGHYVLIEDATQVHCPVLVKEYTKELITDKPALIPWPTLRKKRSKAQTDAKAAAEDQQNGQESKEKEKLGTTTAAQSPAEGNDKTVNQKKAKDAERTRGAQETKQEENTKDQASSPESPDQETTKKSIVSGQQHGLLNERRDPDKSVVRDCENKQNQTSGEIKAQAIKKQWCNDENKYSNELAVYELKTDRLNREYAVISTLAGSSTVQTDVGKSTQPDSNKDEAKTNDSKQPSKEQAKAKDLVQINSYRRESKVDESNSTGLQEKDEDADGSKQTDVNKEQIKIDEAKQADSIKKEDKNNDSNHPDSNKEDRKTDEKKAELEKLKLEQKQRVAKRKRHADLQFCENCNEKFTVLADHIKSPKHAAFVKNSENFYELDQLLKRLKRR
ncbi:hypothetical protein RO3G_04130 [Rhizopus delemar RA 99-880]|uniref:DBF4-type domain-containing protein n=1 Tax=Rhizopus delemar (strain RA 99-880 / ATCC MYA-4621 / FGSC 9543 / NRRL 43880) TaxID=246409 RepID=I1BT95_RHIO9|nr:hypothetical protein RO3G_04130 [Rhizopus delemar RA 99-880]|eukprot:EIE79425.1 hypothetical protein RO3G_04130 [Rhizopus delemar RA 99-880]